MPNYFLLKHLTVKNIHVPLENAETIILKYCNDGKPLFEDGPVHILYKDGSNEENPIRNVVAINVD